MKDSYRRLYEYRKEIFCILVLFGLALGLRLLYQSEAVVDVPIRADAGRYFRAAYNLFTFGVYSTDQTLGIVTPVTRTDLSPGYPVFLMLLIRANDTLPEFIDRVLTVQAWLGAVTVVLTFLLARQILSWRGAFLAGLFTTLSPHMIAADGYVLTESLFTFVMVAGILVFLLAWKEKSWVLTLVASLLLAFSGRVRAINLLLLPTIAPFLLLDHKMAILKPKGIWLKHLAAVIVGVLVIGGMHQGFMDHFASGGPQNPEDTFVSTSKAFQVAVLGSYPWYYDEDGNMLSKKDPEFDNMWKNKEHFLEVMKKRIIEQPARYISWYLGGKILFLWNWDNLWNDGPYIYPMKRKGFENNIVLLSIYKFMHVLHWPIYALTLLSPFLVLFSIYKKEDVNPAVIPIIVLLVYFLGIFTILQAIPRYAVPLRPYIYILSIFSCSWLLNRQRIIKRRAY